MVYLPDLEKRTGIFALSSTSNGNLTIINTIFEFINIIELQTINSFYSIISVIANEFADTSNIFLELSNITINKCYFPHSLFYFERNFIIFKG